MSSQSRERHRITAVLGPTNTGKTYLAIERMLAHDSGMVGFPLRLLARENYDRVARIKGRNRVALITGEEKILPDGARYFLCTVESMPLERNVDFLAVDEIQLCGDPERGHVFTERLFHARGNEETMFLGADTIRPLLRRLLPEAEIVSRPRFSQLSYKGRGKLARLPARSAVVAFSTNEVYSLAEHLRRFRGGTAVVLGALSPRTRNAQVGMFESGEVDYLVATDAIGMGLNLSLDHVAFSSLSKFDGRRRRRLTAQETAQIAGRAGRHMANGSFGATEAAGAIPPEIVSAVENHQFEPLSGIYWRNRTLDFRSLDRLLASLDARADDPALLVMRDAADHQVLSQLARDPEVAAAARHKAAVRQLWEVCQLPDFHAIRTGQHGRLVKRIFLYLAAHDGGVLPEDWVAAQMARIDDVKGDIDSLTRRIADIRTWTFVAYRGSWLKDRAHWRARAREIEDRLSDALHDRLTQRFVDRRSARIVRRLKRGEDMTVAIRANGEVLLEGESVGLLRGFRFEPDPSLEGEDLKHVLTASRKALLREMPRRLAALEQEEPEAFSLEENRILWHGAPLATLEPGPRPAAPGLRLDHSDYLEGPARERLRVKLAAWLTAHLADSLPGLIALESAQKDPRARGPLRGLLYQLAERQGLLERREDGGQVKLLSPFERRYLARLGVRLGTESLFMPAFFAAERGVLNARLWALRHGEPPPSHPGQGVLCFTPEASSSGGALAALGYITMNAQRGPRLAIRADALERLAKAARKLARQGPFQPLPALSSLIEAGEAELETALTAIGYAAERDAGGVSFRRRSPGPKKPKQKARSAKARERAAESPFAKLRQLSQSSRAGGNGQSGGKGQAGKKGQVGGKE